LQGHARRNLGHGGHRLVAQRDVERAGRDPEQALAKVGDRELHGPAEGVGRRLETDEGLGGEGHEIVPAPLLGADRQTMPRPAEGCRQVGDVDVIARCHRFDPVGLAVVGDTVDAAALEVMIDVVG
jgi:hypothetical protein